MTGEDKEDAVALVEAMINKEGSKQLKKLVTDPHPKIKWAIESRIQLARRGWKRRYRPYSHEADEGFDSTADDNHEDDPPTASNSRDKMNIGFLTAP